VWDSLTKANVDEAENRVRPAGQGHRSARWTTWVSPSSCAPEAKFNDGTPVTAEDVAWDLRDPARKRVARSSGNTTPTSPSVTVESPLRVVFHFKTNNNNELPLILGQMQVLPKHWFAGRDFDKPLTDPPLGVRALSRRPISSSAAPCRWERVPKRPGRRTCR